MYFFVLNIRRQKLKVQKQSVIYSPYWKKKKLQMKYRKEKAQNWWGLTNSKQLVTEDR